jgi:hypothetical protein
MNEIATNSGKDEKTLGVYDLMDDWFHPKKDLIKHVIIIQMIACIIVSMFLLVTSGDQLSSEGLLMAIILFMVFVGGSLGFYNRMVGY